MKRFCMDKDKSEEIAQLLNIYLANLNIMYTKLHNYHWNVVGTDFFVFHDQLGELYEIIGEYIDKIAERIIMLGYKPIGSLAEAIDLSTITEAISEDISAEAIAYDLIEDFIEMLSQARYISSLAAENYDDNTTAILADHISFFEKYIWFFNAYLSTPVDSCKFMGSNMNY